MSLRDLHSHRLNRREIKCYNRGANLEPVCSLQGKTGRKDTQRGLRFRKLQIRSREGKMIFVKR